MLFLCSGNTSKKITSLGIRSVAEFNFNGLHLEILRDDYSHVISSNSTLLVYEAIFPNQILKTPSITESTLINLLDDTLRYFLLLDSSKRTIIVAKGLSAARSLYYYVDESQRHLFCSTKITLLREHGIPLRENKDALPEFFVSRFVAPPNTIYDKIFQVGVGQKVKITLNEDSIKVNIGSSYRPPEVNHISLPARHYSSKLLELITEEIAKIIKLDSNSSFLLSGGLDSSVLTKIGIDTGKVHKTFSTSYPFIDPEKDTEKQYALSAAKAFEVSHKHFEATTREFLEGVVHCTAIAEVPIQWPQSVMLHLLFTKFLPKESRAIVSGFGADGLFGGDLFQLNTLLPFIRLLSFLSFSKIVVRALRFFQKDARILSASLKRDFDNPENAIWYSTSYCDESWVSKKFRTTKRDIIKGRLQAIQQYRDRPLFDIICLLDLFEGAETQMIWNSLAESVGKRVFFPFANKKIVDFAFTIPWKFKLQDPKYLVRRVAYELAIPEFIITRVKSGFGIGAFPKIWATPEGVFAPLVKFCSEYFSDAEIQELQTGDKRKAATLWSMILYSIWRKIMIENVPVSDLLKQVSDQT